MRRPGLRLRIAAGFADRTLALSAMALMLYQFTGSRCYATLVDA